MEDVKLHHPVPTRTTYLPEPPSTPASPHGYQRFTSSPAVPHEHHMPHQSQHHPPHQPHAYGSPLAQPQYGAPPPQPAQYQSFAAPGLPGHQQPAYGFVPPNMWGVNDATAQIGMQLGHSAVQAGQEYMQKNFGTHLVPLSLLKHHFNVSNRYVLNKLGLVLFPWRHKPWSRKARLSEVNGQPDGYMPPRDDINSPDLYIPTMALVTYVLLAALHLGLRGEFDPRVLGTTASSALACVLLEFFFVKLGCYLLNIQGQGQVIDLVAYGGYKFVGIIITLIAGLLRPGRALYYLIFAYSFCANAFFLLRSLRYVVLPDPASAVGSTFTHGQRGRRVQFLFFIAASQAVYMFFLVPSRPVAASS